MYAEITSNQSVEVEDAKEKFARDCVVIARDGFFAIVSKFFAYLSEADWTFIRAMETTSAPYLIVKNAFQMPEVSSWQTRCT